MFLKKFYSVNDGNVAIDAVQASLFAKEVAGDFNPLHDPDSRRFCVPGDLLFSLVLEKYGLSEKMNFTFAGMVGHGVKLNFPDTDAPQFDVTDNNDKTYLQVERSGPVSRNEAMIEAFVRDYVAFSGQNFPYVLVPLLEKKNVMINLERPLVIYDSMTIEFEHLDFVEPQLEMLEPELDVTGKRGSARLYFQIKSAGAVVGCGYKKLAISGLRAFEAEPMQQFVDNYLARKEQYLQKIVA
ncbi:DUF3581 domain-containing protein [Methylomarinum sp. Ch1-1]|uniref:DUF3581 domain-containing protein n=1 Tax=Methylomarinum roseum TaxID=3067653 RepID=A0AAU7NQ54_9GAMM|nr:DUF3581 domain-containing protein [Methylomarinum sp. Ch1-1]MDP4520971.1 DUF3581 domain-containing protein [Methylomarinum sp. Ch1-1]